MTKNGISWELLLRAHGIIHGRFPPLKSFCPPIQACPPKIILRKLLLNPMLTLDKLWKNILLEK